MLNRIEPLRNELSSLENEAVENKHKYSEIQRVVADLEKSIAGYKEEYALLISQAQAIKTDLANVEAKVSDSKTIISGGGVSVRDVRLFFAGRAQCGSAEESCERARTLGRRK